MNREPLFGRLVGASVETEEIDPSLVDGGLLPPEADAIAGAAQRRVQQFTAGRVCARRALGRLGAPADVPILQSDDRAPIWPGGFVGSITHTEFWCAVAVARAEEVRSIGIDLEPATPLKEGLWKRVCTPAEREWARTLENPGLIGKIVFSAKESVYKCQYPLTRRNLGFQAVEVDLEGDSFHAIFRQDAGVFREGDVLSGRYLVENGIVATACQLEAR